MIRGAYDKFGFDKYGYNKDGYDRLGYDRNGYDSQGYDRNGVNKNGINKLTGYDKDGYDADGYDHQGFDRDGYDKEGYNADGYDHSGYNRDGYDIQGFDRDGYNKAGYDHEGFNKWGYDKFGFDRKGIDKEGYDREGYDQEGYNREGYDTDGYDKDGYDTEGYDKEGYDREGFDNNGINKDGYNRDGVDRYGFHYDGKNENGFDISGISKEGIDILGYDRDGFDENGLSLDGMSRESFDEDGYNIYTGYNLKGFDRTGFNINGIDEEGYDREGYHFETGYNRDGFDRDGYNRFGYNSQGYDRKGYDKSGYNQDGYDEDGFDLNGYDESGYNRNGYDKQGYDINGYDSNGDLNPDIKQKEISDEMDEKQNQQEAIFAKKCEAQIRGYYRNQVEKEVMKEYKPVTRTYIDHEGFIQTDTKQPDLNRAKQEINNRVGQVLANPYFCHIDYRDNPELYLGKQAVHGWITDWADERASLYYQYQMYIGNEETGLNFVRDIMFSKGKYKGYKDLYNCVGKKSNVAEVADEHLSQIIAANQKDKKIHDIIESIQKKQYQIITSDMNCSSLVLGCAGSGKTMILMHKIRYMKYNNPNLKMDDIMVISPTDVLGRESKELSILLQVDKVQQFTTASFYEKCCKDMFTKLNVPYEEFHVVDDGEIIEKFYQEKNMGQLKLELYEIESAGENSDYYKKQQTALEIKMDEHVQKSCMDKKEILEAYKLYESSMKEIQKTGKKDIERLIRQIDQIIRDRESWENMQEIMDFLHKGNIFKQVTSNKKYEKEQIQRLFYYTRKVADSININEFIRVCYRKQLVAEDPVQVVQIFQLFMNEKMDIQTIHKVLDEWNAVHEQEIVLYIEYIDEQISRIDHLEQKKEVLQYLLNNALVKNRVLENNSIKYDSSFEKLLKLFNMTQEKLYSNGFTPFSYFQQYEKLIRRGKRLRGQKADSKSRMYIFDALLEKLEINYRIDSDIFVPLSKAYAMAYLLEGYTEEITREKKYIFVDEFQDFSISELELIKSMYPMSILNLFGDVNQCINKKGISRITDIPSDLYEREAESIDENYRNAKQITEYVNKMCGMKMLPVGLDGIQKDVIKIPELEISEDDRVAIITCTDFQFTEVYENCTPINLYTNSGEIIRGVYNVIPISKAKGLEFEKVIVVQQGMSDNEFYVACTRAISELYVIKSGKDSSTILLNDSTLSVKEIVEEEESYSEAVQEEKNLVESQVIDLQGYELIPYEGKLKKYTGMKRVPATHIMVNADGKQKSIPICYIKEQKQAYVQNATYNKHKKELDEYFRPVLHDEKDGTKNKTAFKEKIPRDLVTYVFEDTRTVELMDRFEGIIGNKPYDRLIIKSAMYISINGAYENITLVIERSRHRDYQGDITFTKFKKGEYSDLKQYICEQLKRVSIQDYKETGKMYKFDKPYLLRAQNSRNRTGYGWEWDWSDPYDPMVTEGTLYGETTNYVFTGVYMGESF